MILSIILSTWPAVKLCRRQRKSEKFSGLSLSLFILSRALWPRHLFCPFCTLELPGDKLVSLCLTPRLTFLWCLEDRLLKFYCLKNCPDIWGEQSLALWQRQAVVLCCWGRSRAPGQQDSGWASPSCWRDLGSWFHLLGKTNALR